MPIDDAGPGAEERGRIASELSHETHNLTEEVMQVRSALEAEKAHRAEAEQQTVKAQKRSKLAIVVAGIAIALLVFTAFTAWRQGPRVTQIGKENHKLLLKVTSCVDAGDPTAKPPRPPGACYARGVQSQVAAIGAIERLSIFIAECAKSTPTDGALETCVQIKGKAAGFPPDLLNELVGISSSK